MEENKKDGPECLASAPKGVDKGAKISKLREPGSGQSLGEGDSQTRATSSTTNTSEQSTSKKAEKKFTDYQLAKRDLDNARFILKKAEKAQNSGEDFSKFEERIVWAKDTLKDLTETKMKSLKEMSLAERREILKEESNSKRVRSKESQEDGNKRPRFSEGKRSVTKSLDRVPYCEIVKLNLRICIVNINAPEWKVELEKFRLIEELLVSELADYIINNPDRVLPVYRMNETLRGHHIITCDSTAAADFIRHVISNNKNLWEGADLEVKELSEIPAPIKIYVAIPNPQERHRAEFDKIVKLVIKGQNPELDTSKWTIVGKVNMTKSNRVLVTFIIDTASKEILEKKELTLNYGVRSCKVRINKEQTQTEEIEQDLINQLVESLAVDEVEESMEAEPPLTESKQ